jgi:nascent polypeptide-associated complex subunit alpha
MMPGMNPRQMQGMMKKMGISQVQINASRVIFETAEGNLVIDNPDVLKIKMQGQESYQVTGEAHLEEADAEISLEDVELVSTKTGKTNDEARAALEEADGDIAEAIMKLSE